jgi:hypothetical protein
MFQKLDMFLSSGEVKEAPHWSNGLRLALAMGHNSVGVSLSSPEDGNISSFLNIVFPSR